MAKKGDTKSTPWMGWDGWAVEVGMSELVGWDPTHQHTKHYTYKLKCFNSFFKIYLFLGAALRGLVFSPLSSLSLLLTYFNYHLFPPTSPTILITTKQATSTNTIHPFLCLFC